MRDFSISRTIPNLFSGKWFRNDSLVLFNSLLDQIPEAAIVYDSIQNRIWMANGAFLKLTAYSLPEVNNSTLDTIFEPFDQTKLLAGEELLLAVILRKGTPLPVMVRSTSLEATGQMHLIRVVPVMEHVESQRKWQEIVFSKLKTLPSLLQKVDIQQTAQEVVRIASELFDTHLVCIYQAEIGFPELTKTSSAETLTLLPDKLPSSDLIRLSNWAMWIPGKRVNTELHRTARINNLSYVATMPLGQSQAMIGLFVIAGSDSQPSPHLSEVMEILTTFMEASYSHFLLIDNQKQQIESLDKSSTNQKAILEAIQEGVVKLNPDLTILEINPAAEQMLGYSNSDVSGKTVDSILISPDRLIYTLTRAAQDKTFSKLNNISLLRRHGAYFTADVKIIVVGDGNERQLNVIINDISEHEQILAQTRQLEHRAFLGEFIGVFAHEVLNPINSISTGLQLLGMKLGSDHPNQENITRMEADCQRLHHQMEALKNYAKPYEPQKEVVDLQQLISKLIDRWRPRMARYKVNPSVQIPENLPKTLGDVRGLEQVFTNLITNAIDSMSKDGGILTIRAEVINQVVNHPQIHITVSDNGPGIPEEIRDRIFQPFITTKSTGTGLGLPISRRIITAHFGELNFHSVPGGTVFYIKLPVYNEG